MKYYKNYMLKSVIKWLLAGRMRFRESGLLLMFKTAPFGFLAPSPCYFLGVVVNDRNVREREEKPSQANRAGS